MNLFLVAGARCDRAGLETLRRLSTLIPVLGCGEICILTGYGSESLACATEAQTILGGAEVLPSHLCAARDELGFSEICLRAELLLERICTGSLASRGTLLVVAPTRVIQGILQAAFRMRVEDAESLPIQKNAIRWIKREGEHFFDLGELTETALEGEDAEDQPLGGAPMGGGNEEEEEQEREYLQTYFKSIQYHTDAMTFVQKMQETVKSVQTVIERRTEWGYGMQRPPDFVRDNDLRLLCALMKGAVALAIGARIGQALGQAPTERELSAQEIPSHEIPSHEENYYGIEPEPSREQNGRTHGNEMQNSK